MTTNLKRFKLAELKIATHNFSPDMQLGKGYFQSVFTGWLNEKTYTPSKIGGGMAVAVKKFNVNSPQSFEAWKVYKLLFLTILTIPFNFNSVRKELNNRKILSSLKTWSIIQYLVLD